MAFTKVVGAGIHTLSNITSHNIHSSGIVTATGLDISGNATVGGVLTYEDVTSIDSVGIVTARAGVNVSGGQLEVGSNIKLGNAGVITATSFVGSGAALTGIDVTSIKDSSGNVKIQAQASGAVHTGVSTFTGNADFSAGIDVTGNSTFVNNLTTNGILNISTTAPILKFTETDNSKDFFIVGDSNYLSVRMDTTGGGNIIQKWNSDGSHRFYNTVGFSNDIDVDGHTNLDNVSIAGVTTFSGGVYSNSSINLGGELNFTGNGHKYIDVATLNGGNTLTIRHQDGGSYETAAYFDANGGGYLQFNGATKFATTNTGVNITGTAVATGADINGDLDVDGHTNLDNVSIAGVSTFSGNVKVDTGKTLVLTSDTSNPVIKIQGAGPNFITFATDPSGSVNDDSINLVYRTTPNTLGFERSTDAVNFLTVDADDGLVRVYNNLNVDDNLDVDGHTNLDNVSIAGVTTMGGNLRLEYSYPRIYLKDTNHNPDFSIINNNGKLGFYDDTNAAYRFQILSNGDTRVYHNLIVDKDLDVDGHTELDNVSIAGVTTTTGQLTLSGTHDEKLILSGSAVPYIRFQENTTDKAYIQWSTDGFLQFVNQETGEILRIKSDELTFTVNGTENKVFHAGNDGPGSGLNADTLDGVQGSSFLRSDANDTASGDLTFNGVVSATNDGNTPDKIGDFKIGRNNNSISSIDNLDSFLLSKKDGGFSSGTKPSGTNNAFGVLSLQTHSGDYFSQLGFYSSGNELYIRSANNTTTYSNWQKVWSENNDGSGSGLDADTLDGIEGSAFLRSNTNDTMNGTLTYTTGNDTAWTIENGKASKWSTSSGTTNPTVNFDARSDGGTGARLHKWNSPNLGGGSYQPYQEAWYDGNSYHYLKVEGDTFKIDGNKIFHAGNDGSGSGLDADTLDGVQGSSFLRSDATDTCSGQITFTGATFFNNTVDFNTVGYNFNINRDNNDRISFAFNANSTREWALYHQADGALNFVRASGTGSFEVNNYRVLTTADEGSGNGIDADTLDNLQATSFLRSDAADTMTSSTANTPTLIVRNTAGAGSGTDTGAIIAEFKGDSDALRIRNIGGGDYGIYNTQQNNGIEIYDGTGGVRILYNGNIGVEFDSGNNYGDFKGVPTVNGTNLVRASDTIASATNADTVDSLHATSFLRSDANDVCSGRIQFTKNETSNYDTIATSSSSQGAIEIKNTGSGNDAFMTFHTGGDYAVYFGLDADANRLAVGGWSMGAVKHSILHEKYAIIRGSSAGNSHGIRISMDGSAAPASVGHNSTNPEGIFWHNNTTNYGIYRTAGNWSGNYQQLRIDWLTGIILDGGSAYGLSGVRFDCHAMPTTNNTYDLGTSSLRFRNLYVNDLQLSNEAKKEEGGNDVDGTWGNYTIQEGEDDLFLINNRSGKKYKFNLTEVN